MSSKPLPSTRRAKRGRIEFPIVPSAFFGTSLATTLHTQQINSIILINCSTSGRVRATAVDGIEYGFRVIVARECVGDRLDGPHDASPFDIDAKYGDVLPRQEVEAYFLGPQRR